jgi:hypothetical protein
MDRSENVLSWNVPNVITIFLMVSLIWAVLGIGSHLLFRKGKGPTTQAAVQSDTNGNIVSA